MKNEEQEKLKFVITERFITALDYLVDSGRVNSVAEMERITGIRAQRITGMRAYLNGESKTSQYAGIQHIKILKDTFGVSLEYIFDGQKPIVSSKTQKEIHTELPDQSNQSVDELREDLSLLKEKVNLINEKLEFYKELVSQKL